MARSKGMERAAETVVAVFEPVAERYGLALHEVRAWEREARVAFAGGDVVLQIHLEVGCDPYVTAGVRDGEGFGLRQIVGDRAPELEGELVSTAEETQGAMLERLAVLTDRMAHDVLGGDCSSFPRLRRVRARQTREDNWRDFGTSTGETPRFEHRPTLEQLFADAANDGMVDARVYQAVWDYEFTIAELAEHCDSTATEIQARLDRWDGLV